MLQQARSKVAEKPITWIEADVANLPLTNQAFDFVSCANNYTAAYYAKRFSSRMLSMVLRDSGIGCNIRRVAKNLIGCTTYY